jgi:recombinational DNA repair protein RecR
MYPAPLARLIQELSKLPGIGEKSAARLAFHMLKGKRDDVFRLADSIGRLRQEMGLCDRVSVSAGTPKTKTLRSATFAKTRNEKPIRFAWLRIRRT